MLLLLPCSRLSREYCLFTFEKGRTFLIMHKIFRLPYFSLSLPGCISWPALCFPGSWETNRVNAFNSSGDKLIVTFSTPPSTLCFFKHKMNTTQRCSPLILSIWSQCRWGQADWNIPDFFLEHDSLLIWFKNHWSIGFLLRISVDYLRRETFQIPVHEARLELLVGDIPGSLTLWPNSLGYGQVTL